MRLHTKPVLAQDNSVHWILYESGKLEKPMAVLTDHEMRNLIRDYENSTEETLHGVNLKADPNERREPIPFSPR